MSRVVFVGNVPYTMGEAQLTDVFKSVGHVVGFRLVYDRETGKPRGYGFCEFADHETAASAVRNLNNVDVGGRPLRIDLADSDPFLEGKTTVRGELIDSDPRAWRDRDRDDYKSSGPSRSPQAQQNPNTFLSSLPPGLPVPHGSTSLDTISQTLATMSPNQLMEVLAQMKAFVITHPEQSRTLLVAHPQLAYALFQALLLNKIVDPAILQRMLAATSVTGTNAHAPPPPQPQPPQVPPHQQHVYHPPPPIQPPQSFMPTATMPVPPVPVAHPSLYSLQHQHQHQQPPAPQPIPAPPQQSYYMPPPPVQPASAPQGSQAPPTADINIDSNSRAMLMQVLSLTPDQINSLPPTERDAIQQLRNQFMSGITV